MPENDEPTVEAARSWRLSRESAIRHLSSHAWLWGVTLAVLALDLWSKAWAFRSPALDESPQVLGGLFTLKRSLNPGALFGFGQGLFELFIVASLAALGFVLYLFACSTRRQWVLHAGLALILAGALGNLYDRATNMAHVVKLKAGDGGDVDTFIAEVVGDLTGDPVQLREWGSDRAPQAYPRDQVLEIESKGVVRDFIKFEGRMFGIDLWPWVFNVADIALTIGVAILLIHYWVERRSSRPHEARGAALDA